MFWRKKKAEDFVERNPFFFMAFGEAWNELSVKALGFEMEFVKYIEDPRIVKNIDEIYRLTKASLSDKAAGDVYASLVMNTIEQLREDVSLHDALQLGRATNTARDIIFSYAPAIAEANKNDVYELTKIILLRIVEGLENSPGSKKPEMAINYFNIILHSASPSSYF